MTQEQIKLTREQKEAIGLLSIGTTLEYFDFMLYIHMAVLLNDLFFPKTDPNVASLLTAFAFCSSYLLRPFGAFIFGWVGDHIGRKYTVVITTTLMGLSCIVMANLPTYETIGITAAWVMIICRMVQGVSSMGEYVGAGLYLTEMTKPPVQYIAVGMIDICSIIGGTLALAWGAVCTSYLLNWRLAFWGGACIAVIGAVARTKLREAPEFADAKRRFKKTIDKFNSDSDDNFDSNQILKNSYVGREKPHWKTSLAFFLIQAGGPPFFYFLYMYCADFLKRDFHYTSEQIIQNNFLVSMWSLVSIIFITFLSQKMNPLKIIKLRSILFLISIILSVYYLSKTKIGFEVLLIQLLLSSIGLYPNPAIPIFYKNFPIFKRFTYSSVLQAMSRVLMYVVTSVGMAYLAKLFGHYGILFIMVPLTLAFYWGVCHFEKLEENRQEFFWST